MTLNYQQKYKNGQLVSRGIEWTDATWNPIAGCQHGCRWEMPDGSIAICYAENIAEGLASHAYQNGFSHHYWKPHHLDSPKKQKQHLKIFVGSMADVFGHWVEDEQINAILDVARECPQHVFQFLTKNPVRTVHFDMPTNVWIGSSSPPDFMWNRRLSQQQKERMLHRMLDSLERANASIKWMSFEPLSWDVSHIVQQYSNTLDWAVIGAASNGSKLYAPDMQDFNSLKSLLIQHNVKIFYKGNMKILEQARVDWFEEFPQQEIEAT
jgi:protein gp37